MMTSRERRIAWLQANTSDRHGDSVNDLVLRLFRHHGFDWLTDDQIDQMTDEKVKDERFSSRIAIQNRNRSAA